jgi:hypothetical protein
MAQEKIYPKGITFFKPRDNAPDFVKGQMIITPKHFIEWAKTMEEYYSEYNNEVQLKFDILDGNNGLYASLNTFKPQGQNLKGTLSTPVDKHEDDLPF